MPHRAGHDDWTRRIPPKMKKSVYKMFRTCKRGREACEGEMHVRVHGPDPPVQFGPLTVRSRPRPARKLSHPGAYGGARRLLGMCLCHLPVSRLGARLHLLITVPHPRCMRSARWVELVACLFAVNLRWTDSKEGLVCVQHSRVDTYLG